MQNKATFREIFIAHLSQNSVFSEEKLPNFDHTFYELPRISIEKPHSTNLHGPKFYQNELKKFPLEAPMKTSTPSATKEQSPPQQEFTLTMKHLNSPELMAAASIVSGYLGENEFIPRTTTQFKKAYRKMILKEHPDQGGCLETFPETLAAFRILLEVFAKIEKETD